MLQHGSYTLLLDACYDREQFPTLEEAVEWTWASTEEEIAAVSFVLSRFFDLVDGVYISQEIKEALDQYQKNSLTNKRIAIERETKRKKKSTKRTQSVNDLPKKGNEPPPNYKPLTKNQELLTNSSKPLSSKPDKVIEIFSYWCEVMKKSATQTKLTPSRHKAIAARLKDGYSMEDIKTAILNCSNDPFSMGKNDRHKPFNDLELICRNGEKLESFFNSCQPTAQKFSEATQQTIINIQDVELD